MEENMGLETLGVREQFTSQAQIQVVWLAKGKPRRKGSRQQLCHPKDGSSPSDHIEPAEGTSRLQDLGLHLHKPCWSAGSRQQAGGADSREFSLCCPCSTKPQGGGTAQGHSRGCSYLGIVAKGQCGDLLCVAMPVALSP